MHYPYFDPYTGLPRPIKGKTLFPNDLGYEDIVDWGMLGASLRISDVNGDTYPDIVIGAPGQANDITKIVCGSVAVAHSDATGASAWNERIDRDSADCVRGSALERPTPTTTEIFILWQARLTHPAPRVTDSQVEVAGTSFEVSATGIGRP